MPLTLAQLATMVRGTVVGDADLPIHAARTLQEAQPGDITFVEKRNNVPLFDQSKASAAVVPLDFPETPRPVIRTADPLMAFVAIVQHFQGKTATRPTGIDPRATVDETARLGDDPSVQVNAVIGANTVIGKRCQIYPGVVIGKNCRLGDDVVLHPNVVIYDDTILGDRVIVHANSVIGADGFGYRFHHGRHVKIPQLGNVIVGNDVEVGASCCIDRGAFGPTIIGEGTKFDNFVQIAHNCKIGKHNALAAQVGIAGSSTTGDYVVMGGQAGVSDHVNVGAQCMVGAKTGIFRDIPAKQRVFLSPAHEEKEAARICAIMKKLPSMRKDLLRILKELGLPETERGVDELRKAS